MERTNKGLDIILKAESTVRGMTVCLTRKTTKRGNIRHGVVLEDRHSGRHQLIGSFVGIAPAWAAYKGLRRAWAVYRVEWDDHEGNRHELTYDRLSDAEAEAAALRGECDYVNLLKVKQPKRAD